MGLTESTVDKSPAHGVNSPAPKSKSNLAVHYLLGAFPPLPQHKGAGRGPPPGHGPPKRRDTVPIFHHPKPDRPRLVKGLTDSDIRNSNTLLPNFQPTDKSVDKSGDKSGDKGGDKSADNKEKPQKQQSRGAKKEPKANKSIATQTTLNGYHRRPASTGPVLEDVAGASRDNSYHPSDEMLGGEFTGKVLMLSNSIFAFQKVRRNPKDKRKRNFSVPVDPFTSDAKIVAGASGTATLHSDCNFTCHQGCREAVTLDCESVDHRSPSDGCCPHPDLTSLLPPEGHQVRVEEVTEEHLVEEIQETVPISPDEEEATSADVEPEENLAVRIQYYNSHAAQGLEMTLEADGSTFRGFIRVHLNLTRPINVVAGTRPPSIYDILKEDDTLEKKTLTTFYLPRDTVRALHVTSETTAQEVIRSLLKKFKVVDNPRKFALYERYYDHGETTKVKMRLIPDNERPLVLALMWGCDQNCNKRFVLQENETGDILWEAFTLPELNNFLRILDREEEEYKRQVRQKYKLMEMKIREAMERLCPDRDEEAQSGGDEVTLRAKPCYSAQTTQRESSVDDDEISDGTLKSLDLAT